jgi:acyl-CoA dehydrogenase
MRSARSRCRQYPDRRREPAADLRMLKVRATRTQEFCARVAVQIFGGAGYMRGVEVERIYREVRVDAIGGGWE